MEQRRSYGYYLQGELNTALRCAEQGLKMQKDTELPFFLPTHHYNLSSIKFDLGEMSEAEFHVAEALRIAQENNIKQAEGVAWIQLGRIAGRKGGSQLSKAEKHLLNGMKILDEMKIKPFYAGGYLFLGELWAEAGQKERAQESLKQAEELFQQMGMDYWLARTRNILGRLQG